MIAYGFLPRIITFMGHNPGSYFRVMCRIGCCDLIPSSGVILSDYDTDYPTIMGFEPLLNQRLLPPTFPRYTKIRGRDDTLAYLEGLVSRLQTVCAVTELSGLHATLVSVQSVARRWMIVPGL